MCYRVLKSASRPCRSNPDDFTFPFDLRGVRSREEAFAITGRPYLLEPTRDAYIDHREIRDLEVCQLESSMSCPNLLCKLKGLFQFSDHSESQQLHIAVLIISTQLLF